MNTQNPLSSKGQRSVIVDAWGLDEWAKLSGGETASDATEVWDGGAKRPEYIAGRAKTSNLVVTKPYRPIRDDPRCRDFDARCGTLVTAVHVLDRDPELDSTYGPPRTYRDARLVRVKWPEAEAGSSDTDEIELEFATAGLAPI